MLFGRPHIFLCSLMMYFCSFLIVAVENGTAKKAYAILARMI